MQRKILAVVPARGGSKGVPRKNVRLLGGKPMIGWTLAAAQRSQYITELVVSTDDAEIKQAAEACGVRVIDRPAALAQDNSTTVDAVRHTLDCLAAEGYVPELVLLLQCTTPFRTTESIDGAISALLTQNAGFDSLLSVEREEYPPYWLKNVGADGALSDFLPYDKTKYTRRQDFPTVYKLNGAIYLTTEALFRANNSFTGARPMAYTMDAHESVDIDTEADFAYAAYVAEHM